MPRNYSEAEIGQMVKNATNKNPTDKNPAVVEGGTMRRGRSGPGVAPVKPDTSLT